MSRTLAFPIVVLLAACTQGEIVILDPDEPALPDAASYAPGRVMVAFDGAPPAEIDVAGLHLEAIRVTPALGLGLYALPDHVDVESAVQRLRESDQFAAVDADLRVEASGRATVGGSPDPYRDQQWNLDALDIEAAWASSRGDGVTVAIVDSGVSAGTDGFASLLPGWDFVDDDPSAADANGHGTHVAGTVAQRTDNGVGCAGVAPLARILPVRVLDATGSGWTSDVVAGIDWAVENGADVINLSLGSSSSSTAMAVAVLAARESGVIVVAASGNDGKSGVSYPAAMPGVVGVGATDAADTRAWYSNTGPEVDLVAPGGDSRVDLDGDGVADGILQETVVGGTWSYRLYQGTSMATPHVSGAFALLLAAGATPDEAEAALSGSAADLGDAGPDDVYGAGLVQPAAALDTILDPVGDTTPPVVSSVRYTAMPGGAMRLSWRTDEPATSQLCRPDGVVCVDSPTGLSTEHFAGARRGGRYVVLTATDEAGNTSVSGPYRMVR